MKWKRRNKDARKGKDWEGIGKGRGRVWRVLRMKDGDWLPREGYMYQRREEEGGRKKEEGGRRTWRNKRKNKGRKKARERAETIRTGNHKNKRIRQ